MAFFLIVLFLIPLGAALLYRLLPKGNILHEVLHLPRYWLRLYGINTDVLQPEKVSYGQHPRQYFMMVPPPPGSPPPDKLIIYFHGGGWRFGRPEHFTAFALPFHEQGLPVILPSVRRTPRYDYFDIRKDLDQLMLTVKTLQIKQGWNDQQIVLGGMSAGGNLAALLYYDRKAMKDLQLDPDIFCGLFVCGAPLDLSKMRASPVLRAFAGKRGSRQFELASPVSYLAGVPAQPILCIHGDQDGLVEFRSAESFCDQLSRDHPEAVHFLPLPGGTHLDAASWSHADPTLKREILSWLKKL